MYAIVFCCRHLMTFVPSVTFHIPVLLTPHECATSMKLAHILLSSSWKAHSLYISAGTHVYIRLLLSFCACKKSSSQGFTCLAAEQNCMSAGCTVLAHLRFPQKSRFGGLYLHTGEETDFSRRRSTAPQAVHLLAVPLA